MGKIDTWAEAFGEPGLAVADSSCLACVLITEVQELDHDRLSVDQEQKVREMQ